jgi:hypothetical protein
VNYSIKVILLVTKVLVVLMQRICCKSIYIDNFRVEAVCSTGIVYLDCLIVSEQ